MCFNITAIDGNYQDTLSLEFDYSSELFSLENPAVVANTTGFLQVSSEFCWTPDCEDVRDETYTLDFDVITRYCEHPSDTIHTTLEFQVRTVSDGTLEIVPNVFTPNDDNVNDRWEIKHTPDKCITEEDVQIFDRWGTQVFQAASMQKPWDGDSSEGTYYYLIKYEFLKDPRGESGEITIFR
jgi:gliding motility-associated-like protein